MTSDKDLPITESPTIEPQNQEVKPVKRFSRSQFWILNPLIKWATHNKIFGENSSITNDLKQGICFACVFFGLSRLADQQGTFFNIWLDFAAKVSEINDNLDSHDGSDLNNFSHFFKLLLTVFDYKKFSSLFINDQPDQKHITNQNELIALKIIQPALLQKAWLSLLISRLLAVINQLNTFSINKSINLSMLDKSCLSLEARSLNRILREELVQKNSNFILIKEKIKKSIEYLYSFAQKLNIYEIQSSLQLISNHIEKSFTINIESVSEPFQGVYTLDELITYFGLLAKYFDANKVIEPVMLSIGSSDHQLNVIYEPLYIKKWRLIDFNVMDLAENQECCDEWRIANRIQHIFSTNHSNFSNILTTHIFSATTSNLAAINTAFRQWQVDPIILKMHTITKEKAVLKDVNNTNWLYLASKYGNIDAVEKLIAAGADVNIVRDSSGGSPLFIACQEGYLEIVEKLINAGADVDQICQDSTALYMACQEGYLEIVEKLLLAKDRISQKTLDESAFVAAQKGHHEILAKLIAMKANVNKQDEQTNATPIYVAAQNGHTQTIQLLLAANANCTEKCAATGTTPLYAALSEGHEDTIRLLLSAQNTRSIRATLFEIINNKLEMLPHIQLLLLPYLQSNIKQNFKVSSQDPISTGPKELNFSSTSGTLIADEKKLYYFGERIKVNFLNHFNIIMTQSFSQKKILIYTRDLISHCLKNLEVLKNHQLSINLFPALFGFIDQVKEILKSTMTDTNVKTKLIEALVNTACEKCRNNEAGMTEQAIICSLAGYLKEKLSRITSPSPLVTLNLTTTSTSKKAYSNYKISIEPKEDESYNAKKKVSN